MKRTRIVSTPALGIVRQRTGEDAPEGAASDLVNMRLKDGALRPVGDAEQLITLPANASAQAVLFHSALPDGEYLYRVGTIVYHRKATGDVAVMDFAGESFVSWKAFGTALIVVTSKYTRVAVLKDGAWVCVPVVDDTSITISNNPLEGVDVGSISVYAGGLTINGDYNKRIATEIFLGRDSSGKIIETSPFEEGHLSFERPFSRLEMQDQARNSGMVSGVMYAIVCLKLSDGTTLMHSTPAYIQFGECMTKTTYDNMSSSYNSFSISNDAEAYVYNTWQGDKYDPDGSRDRCAIIGGPFFCKPTITVSLSQDMVNYINSIRSLSLLSSISVYTTRLYSIYDAEMSFRDYKNIESQSYLSKSSEIIPDRYQYLYKWKPTLTEIDISGPYYLLKDTPITSDVSSVISINLKPDDFDNLETKEVLRSNGTRTLIRPLYGLTEYNSRLHVYGVISTLAKGECFKPGSTYGYTPYSTTLFTAYLETTIPIDGINHVVKKNIPINTVLFRKGDGTSADTKFAIILPPIVAYPDARATIMRLILVNGSGSHFEAMSIQLKACLEGNFAYAKGTNTDINITQPPFLKVIEPKLTSRWDANLQVEVSEWVFSSDSLPKIPNPPAESREFSQTNRLQVYNYGSPLTFELKNSYRFGAASERLLRCEAAVDQLSEGRFGQFPLYCFTDCGLYALEQGSGEVLYATSHPISADGLISPDGVTPIRGGVAFVTSKGVMFVSGRQVIELSAPIRGEAEYYDAATGLPDAFRFIDVSAALGGPREPSLRDYLAGAELHHLYNEAELIAYNKSYAYAFVYGLDSKMWYRRQLPYANIQRAGTSLLCYNINGTSLYRANMEREAKTCGKPMLYVSRPLEMGSTAYKKLEAAIVRMDATSGGMVRAYLLGSADGVSYGVIQGASAITKENTIHDLRLGRSGVSVRSVVVALLFEANMRTAVQRFDFELEDRFNSKLR